MTHQSDSRLASRTFQKPYPKKNVGDISRHTDVELLTGENDRPSTGRVEPVRGCLITQAIWDEPP